MTSNDPATPPHGPAQIVRFLPVATRAENASRTLPRTAVRLLHSV